jgi:lysophospholipase L1-like esterase
MNRRTKLLTVLQNRGASDTTAPTVAITSSESSPSFANPIPLTFTLSEAATDFAVGDITVGAGGSIGNFAGSGTSYTADLTITTALATVTVDVAANAFHDAAGNGNTAATQFSITSGLALLDNFTTAISPLDSPHTSQPGPGTLTRHQDTNNSISIAANKTLYFDSALVAQNNGYKTTSNWSPTYGLAFRARMLRFVTGIIYGWRRSATLTQTGAAFSNMIGTGQLITLNTASAGTGCIVWAGGSSFNTNKGDYWIVHRNPGAFYIYTYKDIAKLLWVDDSTIPATITAGIHANAANQGCNVDAVDIRQLGAPWTTATAVATSVLAGARASSDAFTHASGNVLMYFTCTTLPSAGNEHDIRFRVQDADNYWKVTIDSAGAIKLFEVVATSATQRGSTYTGVANGNRIAIVMQDAEIDVSVVLTRRITYATAATFLTATAGKVQTVGTDGAISDVQAYPRDLTGTALTALDAPDWDTLVAYGDSVTFGYFAQPGYGDAVSNWLKAYYQNSAISGIVLQNTVQNTVAPTGQALANNMRDNYTTKVTAYNPRYVCLMGGLNDLRFSDAAFSAANFQTDLGEIVDGIIASGVPASRIIICSPPYMNPANYGDGSPYNGGTTPKHVQYVAAAAAVASAKSTIYVDVYQAMLDEADPTALMQADGIHPNATGHAVIAAAIIAVIGGTLA